MNFFYNLTMAKIKYKKLCKKCDKYYLPDGSKLGNFGYCENCRVRKDKCKFINELGYQCQNSPEFEGYCLHHFVATPAKKLIKTLKKDKKPLKKDKKPLKKDKKPLTTTKK